MSYYHFNRKEILQKAKERYSSKKAAEYYLQNFLFTGCLGIQFFGSP